MHPRQLGAWQLEKSLPLATQEASRSIKKLRLVQERLRAASCSCGTLKFICHAVSSAAFYQMPCYSATVSGAKPNEAGHKVLKVSRGGFGEIHGEETRPREEATRLEPRKMDAAGCLMLVISRNYRRFQKLYNIYNLIL